MVRMELISPVLWTKVFTNIKFLIFNLSFISMCWQDLNQILLQRKCLDPVITSWMNIWSWRAWRNHTLLINGFPVIPKDEFWCYTHSRDFCALFQQFVEGCFLFQIWFVSLMWMLSLWTLNGSKCMCKEYKSGDKTSVSSFLATIWGWIQLKAEEKSIQRSDV